MTDCAVRCDAIATEAAADRLWMARNGIIQIDVESSWAEFRPLTSLQKPIAVEHA